MAERSAFFDSQNGDRTYASDDFARVFSSITGRDGVVFGDGDMLEVSPADPSGMRVHVGTGSAWVQGRYYNLYGTGEVLDLAAAHATLPRIDRIVLRMDTAIVARSISVYVKQGTPAAAPAPPTLQRDTEAWEISLAQVYVNPGATTIIADNILDERYDWTVCGFITSGQAGVLDVTRFGASGNGVTDDTAAFQAALAVLEKMGGGVLFVPKGTYLVHSVDIRASNIMLYGEGTATVLKQKPFFFDPLPGEPLDDERKYHGVIKVWGTPFYVGKISNVTVRDLVVDADYTVIDLPPETPFDGDIEGVSVKMADDVLIENVKVIGAHADGFDVERSTRVSIVNCHAEDCGKAGFLFGRDTQFSRMVNCYAEGCVYRAKQAYDEGHTTQYRAAFAVNESTSSQTITNNVLVGCVAKDNYRSFTLLGDKTYISGLTEDGAEEESDFSGVEEPLGPTTEHPVTIDVRFFGAKGDGVTDDTEAFEHALAFLEARGGGALFVPQGTYLVHSVEIRFSNVLIYGEGTATVLRQKGFFFDPLPGEPPEDERKYHGTIKIWGKPLFTGRVSNVTIRDLVVDADYEVIELPSGVMFDGDIEGISIKVADDISLENVRILRAHADGVDVDVSTRISLVNCYAEDCGKAGFLFSRGTQFSRMINCYAEGCVYRAKQAYDQGQTSQYRAAFAVNPTVDSSAVTTHNVLIGCVAKANYRNFTLLGDNTYIAGLVESGATQASDFSGVVEPVGPW